MNNETDNLTKKEDTKELNTLSDLALESLENIANEYQSEFDEHMKDSDLIFKTEVETKEEMKKEEPPKKKKPLDKLKDWWKSLDKKKKIIFSIVAVLVVLLIVGVIVFFILKKDNSSSLSNPDVILEKDNYRYENGTLILLDKDGKELGKYECVNKDEKQCEVAFLNQDTVMDTTRLENEKEEALQLRSSIYHDRFVFIRDTKDESVKSYILYDLKDEKTVSTVYDVLTSYQYTNDIIVKNEKSKYGLIELTDEEAKTVIPATYDELHIIPNQEKVKLVSVRKDNNSYVSNLENKPLTKAFNETIVNANDKYVVTKNSQNKYHVYDYNAKEVNKNDDQDYIVLLKDIMISVRQNKLYVLDYEDNSYSMKDIELKSDVYNKTEVYNDDLKLVNTKKSFDYELTDDILLVNVYDNDEKTNYNVNLKEGRLSKNLAFLNYFDGSLYIYGDSSKKELLGSYRCNNQNTIENNTQKLSNCTIASDSVYRETNGNVKETGDVKEGYIPIIGKKYAFIKDGSSIYLVDLSNTTKPISEFSSVDTSSYTGGEDVTFITPSNLYFIAVSKASGKYGVNKITSDGVSSVIQFNKSEIKRLGDYFVVTENNKYSLYDKNGSKQTEDKASPIVDYYKNYLKTFKDNMFFVHSFDKEISSTAYNYVELYDDFYAAVINHRVHLYRYDEPNKEYIYEVNGDEKGENGLKLLTDRYYGSNVNSFRITFDSKYIYVEIGNTNNTYNAPLKFLLDGSYVSEKEETTDGQENN